MWFAAESGAPVRRASFEGAEVESSTTRRWRQWLLHVSAGAGVTHVYVMCTEP